jgi:hypothetical protein
MKETKQEMYERVRGMSRGDDTWDLSDNDMAALAQVLSDAESAHCEVCHSTPCICEITEDDYEYGEPARAV